VPTSDEELLEKQQAVEEKRTQLAEVQATAEANERALDNDIAAAALDAEAARLDAEIAEAEKRATPEAAEAANASNLGSARDQMEAAIARQRAAEAPVPEPIDPDKVYTYDNPPAEVVEAAQAAAAKAGEAAEVETPATPTPTTPPPAPSSPFATPVVSESGSSKTDDETGA